MDGQTLALLALLLAIAFAMNIVPVLGPPLWTVVTFFALQSDIPIVPTVVLATFAAGLGRIVLALIAKKLGRSLVRMQQADVDEIADLLRRRRTHLLPAALVYSTVLPTSWMFMAAGIIGAPLRPIFLGYWFSRAAIDTFLVLSARTASEELIRDAVLGPTALVAQAFGILTFFLFLRLPWVRWLARLAARAGDEGP